MSSQTTDLVSPPAAQGLPTEPTVPPTANSGTDAQNPDTPATIQIEPIHENNAENKTKEPTWPHLENLKQALGQPYFSFPRDFYGEIARSFNERHDKGVDVVMVRIKEGSALTEGSAVSQRTCHVENRRHWSQESDFQDFIAMLKLKPPEQSTTNYLLVQDMTLAMLNFLYAELRISPAFIASHCYGDLNTLKDGIHSFLACHSGICRQASHPESSKKVFQPEVSQYDFGTFCSKRSLQRNDTAGFHLDWKELVIQTDIEARMEILAMNATYPQLASNWIAMSNKTGFNTVNGSNVIEEPDRLDQKTEVTIGTRIYRPHQTVFGSYEKTIEGADERASWISTECYGHKIEICLFDPARQLQIVKSWARDAHSASVSSPGGYMRDSRYYRYPTFKYPFIGGNARVMPIPDHQSANVIQNTRDAFDSWLDFWCGKCESIEDVKAASQAHFIRGRMALLADTLTALDAAVDDIDRTMSNTGELQQKISHWASSLSGYRAILSDMHHSIQNTRDYVDSMQASLRKSGVAGHPNPAHEEVASALSILQKISEFRKHVARRSNQTFQALMSSMSILESQKAIAEASSVGKLTELAFVFIPVSFAATFFSMQIEALKPTVGKFFLLASLLLLASYSARVFIRSRLQTSLKDSLKEQIYSKGIVPPHEEIPASAYVKICLPKLVGTDPFWSYTVILSFMALGIPVILTNAKTTAFKVVACLLTFVCGVLYGRVSYLWRIKLYCRMSVPMFPISVVFLTGLFAFFWAALEPSLEAPVRTAIACGCAAVLCFITGVFLLGPHRLIAGVFLVAPLPLVSVIPSVLLFKPWSHRQALASWRAGLIVTATCFGFSLAILSWVLIRAWWLQRQKYRYSMSQRWDPSSLPAYVVVVYGITAAGSLTPGMPLVRIWANGHLPRWEQIVLTAVTIGISVAIWYGIAAGLAMIKKFDGGKVSIKLPIKFKRLMIAFVLPVLAGATFLLVVWVGEAPAFDELGAGAKVAISLPWFIACLMVARANRYAGHWLDEIVGGRVRRTMENQVGRLVYFGREVLSRRRRDQSAGGQLQV
ncbi:hypothetical protein TWF696_006495 [Orbilia brochopaga]|uniref:Uncharacterized protein n=1 Tax=Orbilia brochopaga TaxID=3140254 RepID=A0AAV9V2W4_9PEZI